MVHNWQYSRSRKLEHLASSDPPNLERKAKKHNSCQAPGRTFWSLVMTIGTTMVAILTLIVKKNSNRYDEHENHTHDHSHSQDQSHDQKSV